MLQNSESRSWRLFIFRRRPPENEPIPSTVWAAHRRAVPPSQARQKWLRRARIAALQCN